MTKTLPQSLILLIVSSFYLILSLNASPIKLASSLVDRSTLVPPSLDPFYTPPSGYEKKPLGFILATRQVQVAQYGLLPENVQAAYQILYRTSQWDNTASATVATVLIPYNAIHSPSTQIVGYQIAEDAVTTICSPSYSLRQGYTEMNYVAELEILFINSSLAKGITVVTPDYEGPKSEYTIGLTAAHMTLDAVKAALSFKPAVPDPKSVRYALWGYSGGALASAWAAQEQPTYAPELNFAGVALGGLPVNVTAILLNINGGGAAGIALAGITGQMLAFPTFQKFLAPHLNNTAIFPQKVELQCLPDNLVEFTGQNIFSYINISQADFLANQAFKSTVGTCTLGLNLPNRGVPKMPLYLYQASGDEIVVPSSVIAYYQKVCKAGIKSFQFVYNTNSQIDHTEEAIVGSAGALNFLYDRLNGVPVAVQGCAMQSVDIDSVDPSNIITSGSQIFDELQALLGLPIGPL
jgi:hypothetical protein